MIKTIKPEHEYIHGKIKDAMYYLMRDSNMQCLSALKDIEAYILAESIKQPKHEKISTEKVGDRYIWRTEMDGRTRDVFARPPVPKPCNGEPPEK